MTDEDTETRKERTSILGIPGLWTALTELLQERGHEKETAFSVDPNKAYGDSVVLTRPDGITVKISRDKHPRGAGMGAAPRIVVEAGDRQRYPEKLQSKLRRSFVEPAPNHLAHEIMNQLSALLKTQVPAFAQLSDQRAKHEDAVQSRARLARELADTLMDRRTDRHVEGPKEKGSDGDRTSVKALIDDKHGEGEYKAWLAKFELSVDKDNMVSLDFSGTVSLPIASGICLTLAPFLAERITCGKKGCSERLLEDREQRKQRRCWSHLKRGEEDE